MDLFTLQSGIALTISLVLLVVKAFALLDALGMPFSREGRPAGFESLNDQAVAA